MNITITREEYRNLLDLLQIATVVIHAHETGEDPRAEKYDALAQKVLAYSREAGLDSLVEYNAALQVYQPTAAFEETSEATDLIDDFIDDTFWDLLVRRFTDRDLGRAIGGEERLDGLSMTERFSLETPLISRYSNEFDQYGIERLEIVEQSGMVLTTPVKTSD